MSERCGEEAQAFVVEKQLTRFHYPARTFVTTGCALVETTLRVHLKRFLAVSDLYLRAPLLNPETVSPGAGV